MWTFLPILKTTIWGGERIAPFKGIETGQTNIGESWEISGVAGNESVVADGPDKGLTLPQLIDRYGSRLMGEHNYKKFGNRFPLLIKFIDARQDLSVQVHPDDSMAQRLGHTNGKTEMWYVVDSDPGATLALGFKNPVKPEDYRNLIESGEIENQLNFVPIHKGDTFFIPAGAVHAIGKGAFVAEIQQTSDDTYRIYDYHRKDKNGKERELHTELAFEAINFNFTDGSPVKYTPHKDIPVNLANCPYFTTNVMSIDAELMRDYSELDSFVILIATAGKATLRCDSSELTVCAGHSVLIPASAQRLTIDPDGTFTAIETYVK